MYRPGRCGCTAPAASAPASPRACSTVRDTTSYSSTTSTPPPSKPARPLAEPRPYVRITPTDRVHQRPHPHGDSAMSPTAMHYRILIIGGGTARIDVAARLRNARGAQVALIAPANTHH